MTEHALMLALFAVTSSAGIAEMSTSLSYGFYGAAFGMRQPSAMAATSGGSGPEWSANRAGASGESNHQVEYNGGGTAEETTYVTPGDQSAPGWSSARRRNTGNGANSSNAGNSNAGSQSSTNQATYY